MPASEADDDHASQPIQYIRFGEARREDDPGRGVPCYEAVFGPGRIRILTDGIDPLAAGRTLAAARAAGRTVRMVVGRPVGIAADGATLIAVGFEQPLIAYSIDDVELMAPTVSAGRSETLAPAPPARRLVA